MSVSFDCQPQNETPSLDAFYRQYLQNSEKLNLRPVYQRSPCWNDAQMIELLDSIMGYCPMPPVLIYKHEGDQTECIDGQNRLRTIKNYMEQTPSSNDGKPFPWKIHHEDETTEYVYYAETDEFKQYNDAMNHKNKKKGKTFRCMTAREKDRFGDYSLVVQMIRTKLTFEHRKAMFNKWQNGSRISQCDALKNKDTPLCNWIVAKGVERRLGEPLSAYLKSGKKNWLFDIIRLLLVFNPKHNRLSDFIISTLKAGTILKSEEQIDEDLYERMVEQAEEFLRLMEPLVELKSKMTISFMLVWAYLYREGDVATRAMMRKKEWTVPCVKEMIEDETIDYSTLNNGPQEKAFIECFPIIETKWRGYLQKQSSSQQAAIPMSVPIPYKKKSIAADQKKKLWAQHFGTAGIAKCICCQVDDITPFNFEAGHVEAEKKGGDTILDNLRPICAGCNRRMGTCNMKVWMEKEYPRNQFK
jgi:hypothetical protein